MHVNMLWQVQTMNEYRFTLSKSSSAKAMTLWSMSIVPVCWRRDTKSWELDALRAVPIMNWDTYLSLNPRMSWRRSFTHCSRLAMVPVWGEVTRPKSSVIRCRYKPHSYRTCCPQPNIQCYVHSPLTLHKRVQIKTPIKHQIHFMFSHNKAPEQLPFVISSLNMLRLFAIFQTVYEIVTHYIRHYVTTLNGHVLF